jgi:hypothetical protein
MEKLTLDNEKKAAIDDMLVRIFTTNVSTRRRELTLNLLKDHTSADYSKELVFQHPFDDNKRKELLRYIHGLNYELGGPIEKYYDRVRNLIF